MNIEVANRLYQYRKKMGISQEELASRIGVSRQAVSKWERAEASPDTDNLIELSKVYGVTLDEMLQGENDSEPEAAEQEAEPEQPVSDGKDHVSIGLHGIHISDKDGTKVSIDRNGIFVNENGVNKVYTDDDGHVHTSADVAQAHHEHENRSVWLKLPYPILTVVAYLLFGYFNVCGGWGYGWIIFLTIPLYYTLVEAIIKRDAIIFCYPVLAVIIFLLLGFVSNLWHPGWVIFLTIPLYYGILGAFKSRKK